MVQPHHVSACYNVAPHLYPQLMPQNHSGLKPFWVAAVVVIVYAYLQWLCLCPQWVPWNSLRSSMVSCSCQYLYTCNHYSNVKNLLYLKWLHVCLVLWPLKAFLNHRPHFPTHSHIHTLMARCHARSHQCMRSRRSRESNCRPSDYRAIRFPTGVFECVCVCVCV